MAEVSAHRGACGQAGLSLAESYEQAIRLGVHYVEFDARRTRDGRYVVHHDAKLESGGAIATMTLAEYRYRAGDQALEVGELIELARGRVRLHADLKVIGDEPDVLGLLSRLPADEFVVTTLEDESVRRLHALRPDARVGLSLGRDLAGEPPWRVAAVRREELFPEVRVRRCHPDFLAINLGLARLRVLGYAASRGLPAWVWTVDGEHDMRWLAADHRCDVIITNRPDVALQVAKSADYEPRTGGDGQQLQA